ncbi:MAG: phytanoyl-CoA dioxygenase family protein [Aestuariivirga sp.]
MQDFVTETFGLDWKHLSASDVERLNQSFDENGFVVLKNIIPRPLVAAFIEGFKTLLAKSLTSTPPDQGMVDLIEVLAKCIKNCTPEEYIGMLKVYVLSVATKQMMFSDDLIQAIAQIFGHSNISQIGNPVMHVVGDRLKLTERPIHAPFHQDWPALRSSKRTIVCWLPIIGAVGDASLLLKPGSHKSGVFESNTLSNVFEVTQEVLDTFETISFDLDVGDVILFDSFLLHGSVPTQNERVAISFRFEDMNCPEWRLCNFSSNHRYFLHKA